MAGAGVKRLFSSILETAKRDPAMVFLHLGTATGLAGFCMSDPLPLRFCSITSSCASVAFVLTRNPVPSLVPVYWSTCFISVNLYKIYELLTERRAIALTELEEEIYARHFLKFGMRPRQFKRLMKDARIREFQDGATLFKEGDPFPNTVKLLSKGCVKIISNKEELFVVDATKPICFLGDTHLLEVADKATGRKDNMIVPSFSATAIAMANPGDSSVLTLEWDTTFLLKILSEKSETADILRSVLTASVMQKLIDMGSSTAVDKYATMLYAFSVDGVMDGLEKQILSQYAYDHGIDAETHEKCLRKIGWTTDEFSRGIKGNENVVDSRIWSRLVKKLSGIHLRLEIPNQWIPPDHQKK